MFIVTILSASVHAANYSSNYTDKNTTAIEKGYSAREAADFAEALRQVRPQPLCADINNRFAYDPYASYTKHKDKSANVQNPDTNKAKRIDANAVYSVISSARFVKEVETSGGVFQRCVYTQKDLSPTVDESRTIICVSLDKFDAIKAFSYQTQKGVRKNVGSLKNPNFSNVWEPVATFECL